MFKLPKVLFSPKRCGFTTVELVVVIILLSIVAGLTLPTLFLTSRKETLSNTSELVVEKMKSTQTKAISNNQSSAGANKVTGYYVSLTGVSATSLRVGRRLSNGSWQAQETMNFGSNIVADPAVAFPLTIYFKNVSGQVRVAQTGPSGLEEPPVATSPVSFKLHFLSLNSPCQQITVDPSGRITNQTLLSCT